MYYFDDGFKNFAETLGLKLAKAPVFEDEIDLARHQRLQIRNLVALENEFRTALIHHRSGPAVYQEFVNMIVEDKGNILSARPFFRERQEIFTQFISSALKNNKPTAIYRFRVNWTFISWVMGQRNWKEGSGLPALSRKIAAARTELLEENLPLAISQARGFKAATPQNHLAWMDLCQVHAVALLLAIDKFVPPVEKKGMSENAILDGYRSFRAVAIGIMRRDRVNEYSQTLIHFFPRDRQMLYWAHKLLRQFADAPDHDFIANEINLHIQKKEEKTNGEQIGRLLASASVVSGDHSAEPDGDTVIECAVADEEFRPDTAIEQKDAYDQLRKAIVVTDLTGCERKLLKLKGISL
jgi:DNA-directed RNA polymerase specialized sigma subunit